MALVNCKECGKEISESAISCPNCGAPQQNNGHEAIVENKQKSSLKIWGLFIGMVLLVGGGYYAYNQINHDPMLNCDSEQATSMINEIITERGLMYTELGDFKTLESSPGKTECFARFKGFMSGYFDMKYQVYSEVNEDTGEKTIGLKIINVEEAR